MPARLLLVTALLIGSLTGCGVFSSDPRPVATAFLAAIASGDVREAGRLTDDPAAATEAIRQLRNELRSQRVALNLDQLRTGENPENGEDTASASFSADWDISHQGQGGQQRHWRYQGNFELAPADTDEGWAVRWRPAVLHPQLGPQQHVELRAVLAEPTAVLDRTGAPLLTPQPVVTVALDRRKATDLPRVAAALATALRPFDARITEQSITEGANAAPTGQPSVVAVLREEHYLSVRDRIDELPGVSFPNERRLLGPDRDFAAQLTPGIRDAVEKKLAASAGWRIVSVDPVGAEVSELAGHQPLPAATLTTTVDGRIQTSAEDAVDAVPNPAMIVALQPSTGGVLAVAQNAAADAQGALSLVGRYPPGSTFKIVTAAAALQSGKVTVDAPVPCPGTAVIEGRLIPNIDRFDLGTVPLHTAFARSCNTTFAQLAADFAPGQLTDAAYQMGIGRDFDIPGMTTLTGEVPQAQSAVQRAENGFGQGTVLTTPFGMALVASTVAAGGQLPTPALIEDMGTETATPAAQPVPPAIAGGLRSMMREVVTQGTATTLASQGDLHGKTGTAEYGAGGSHGWFVGFRGDLAFATLVVDAGSSGPAMDVSGRFLSALAPS